MSTTTEETTVSTETAKGADAFAAARAAIAAQSTDQDGETRNSDDTSKEEKPPVQEPEKVADEPTEPTEDEDTLTAAELAALPEKERIQAEKWQAKLTQKAQKLSAREKEYEEWKTLNDGIRAKDKAALDVIAKHYGITIAEAKEKVQDTTDGEDLPEELRFLKPVFDKREKALEAKLRAEMAPIKQAQEKLITEATAAETEATLKSFSAEFPGWEKHEKRMIEIGKTILPGSGVTDFDYMKTLYRLASADVTEAEKTKKVVDRINRSAKASEDRASGIQPERVSVKVPSNFADLDNKERMRLAASAAERGEVWEK